jgi:hypothetical protein
MIFLMNLIYEGYYKGLSIKYYDGIDFNLALSHPKDGKKGMLIFFIERWENEVNIWKRDNKIKEVLGEDYIKKSLSEIDNNYIAIYQSDGLSIQELYISIRKKVESGNLPNQPWIPISGIKKGAWNIKFQK